MLSQLALFAAGFLFADILLEMQKRGLAAARWNDWAALAIFAMVLGLPISMWTVRHVLPVTILAFLIFMFNGQWLRRFFSWKPVYLVGGMCYSIYLIHYPLISSLSRWLAHVWPEGSYLPATAMVTLLWLPVVLAVSAAYFILIERPCMDRDWPAKLWRRVKGRMVSTER